MEFTDVKNLWKTQNNVYPRPQGNLPMFSWGLTINQRNKMLQEWNNVFTNNTNNANTYTNTYTNSNSNSNLYKKQ